MLKRLQIKRPRRPSPTVRFSKVLRKYDAIAYDAAFSGSQDPETCAAMRKRYEKAHNAIFAWARTQTVPCSLLEAMDG